VIFRRKAKNEDTGAVEGKTRGDAFFEDTEGADGAEETAGTESAEAGSRAAGPFDSGEVEHEELHAGDRIDLGGLVITGLPGMELRLQVDEQTNEVQAVLLVLEDSALELRAFAAPKTSGIWADVRREIAAEATRMGGTASDADGPFGTELVLVVPVQDPESGQVFSQTSRVIGVDGPRWLLRGTILGRAAVEPEAAQVMEDAFRQVVVVRGNDPMAPREALALQLPVNVEQADPEA
jgi:hypothetical protein